MPSECKLPWNLVEDTPVPFDCDVLICYEDWFCVDKAWKRGLRVSLARAWNVIGSETGRIIQREYWLEKPSFFRWPDRRLIPYLEIIYWMPFEGFPEPPVGDQEKD